MTNNIVLAQNNFDGACAIAVYESTFYTDPSTTYIFSDTNPKKFDFLVSNEPIDPTNVYMIGVIPDINTLEKMDSLGYNMIIISNQESDLAKIGRFKDRALIRSTNYVGKPMTNTELLTIWANQYNRKTISTKISELTEYMKSWVFVGDPRLTPSVREIEISQFLGVVYGIVGHTNFTTRLRRILDSGRRCEFADEISAISEDILKVAEAKIESVKRNMNSFENDMMKIIVNGVAIHVYFGSDIPIQLISAFYRPETTSRPVGIMQVSIKGKSAITRVAMNQLIDTDTILNTDRFKAVGFKNGSVSTYSCQFTLDEYGVPKVLQQYI